MIEVNRTNSRKERNHVPSQEMVLMSIFCSFSNSILPIRIHHRCSSSIQSFSSIFFPSRTLLHQKVSLAHKSSPIFGTTCTKFLIFIQLLQQSLDLPHSPYLHTLFQFIARILSLYLVFLFLRLFLLHSNPWMS